MKIGILTYHSSDNYGAYLQSYALANALKESIECDVEIIDFTMKKAAIMNKKMINFNRRQFESWLFNYCKYKMFVENRKKWLPLSEMTLTSDDEHKFADFVNKQAYDVIIVGSDEVWKLDGFRGFPNPYWLPEITGVKKVAYAVSGRNLKEELPNEVILNAKKLISDFSYIGVRDLATMNLAIDLVENKTLVHMNCDPTFAYFYKPNREAGMKILEKRFHIDFGKKCIGLMCGVPGLAKRVIENYGKEVQIISLYYYYRHTKGFVILTPFEWIDVIAALDGLITTFFHGMVFAIKNDTKFISIENRPIKDIALSKNYDLLKRNGLENNCVSLFDKEQLEIKLEEFIKEISMGKTECDFSKTRKSEEEMFEIFLKDFKKIIDE